MHVTPHCGCHAMRHRKHWRNRIRWHRLASPKQQKGAGKRCGDERLGTEFRQRGISLHLADVSLSSFPSTDVTPNAELFNSVDAASKSAPSVQPIRTPSPMRPARPMAGEQRGGCAARPQLCLLAKRGVDAPTSLRHSSSGCQGFWSFENRSTSEFAARR